MTFYFRIIVFLILTILSSSCSESSSSTINYLPNSTGASGEICIIIDDADRLGAAGQYLQNDLLQPCDQFFSHESQFGISAYKPAEFSKLLKKFRNLLLIDINDTKKNKTPWIDYRKDKWANDQLAIFIHAKDSSDFIEFYKLKSEEIKSSINLADRKRYATLQSAVSSGVSTEKISKKFGIEMNMPSDYFLAAEEKDHLWFKQEKLDYINNRGYQVVLNVVIRVEPFVNDSTFRDTYIMDSADKNTGNIIQNELNNGLVIERKYPPDTKAINYNDNYGVELKGNWKFEHPLMGGPYTSLTLHDKVKNRVITVEGFIFAPKFDKREYMKRLEAILYSVSY